MLEQISAIAARHGVRIATIAHAGDGNLHPLIIIQPGDSAARMAAQAAFEQFLDAAIALGGPVTGEHGVGILILQPDGNAVIDAPGNVALWSTNTYKQTYADNQLPAHGWGAGQASQFGCLNNIWVRESNWNELAGNPKYAYGIPQSSPGSKMAAEGSDWLTNPQTQIRWGEDYIQSKYGSPCQAWAYWKKNHNY
jgi:FAD linked oxidases, C-terminal domain